MDVTPRPVDCLDVKELGYSTSGRYNIYPSSEGVSDVPVEVWCDMETTEGGWTVRFQLIMEFANYLTLETLSFLCLNERNISLVAICAVI